MTKLILLNGPAGVGKSTIAKRYANEHPLTLCLDGDQVMGMVGAWRQHELKARELKLKLITSMIRAHLQSGHDVILPYLVTDASHCEVFASIANENDAEYIETVLMVDKGESTRRLLERGVWGEEGSKQLTTEDTPQIESLYDVMAEAISKRPDMKKINAPYGDVETTYHSFLATLNRQNELS